MKTKEINSKSKITEAIKKYWSNLNNIPKGDCVMCGGSGLFATDNGEFLCKKDWDVNEKILAERQGDKVYRL